MTDSNIQIVIAVNQRLFRQGLRRSLEIGPDLNVVADVSNVQEAIAECVRSRPDILLLDLDMPQADGPEPVRQISALAPTVKVLLLGSRIDRSTSLRALDFGVRGTISTQANAETLAKAIRAVHAGEYWVERITLADWAHSRNSPATMAVKLTNRELQIISEIITGATNRNIAEKYSISEETVKRHLTNIFDKLGVSNRLELALYAMDKRLIT